MLHFRFELASFLNTYTSESHDAKLENRIVELENLSNKSKNNSEIKFDSQKQNIDHNSPEKYPLIKFENLKLLLICYFLVLEIWLFILIFFAKKQLAIIKYALESIAIASKD